MVETIGTLSFSTASTCGHTFLSAELVHRTATCGFVFRMAAAGSAPTLTPVFFPRPTTSPRSLPALAGSMSTADTILKFFRATSWRATPAPIGPRPMIITLVGMVSAP